MDLIEFSAHFSKPRANRYLLSCKSDPTKTIQLYKANLKISQSFYPLFAVLEVVLRNRLDEILINYFNDRKWIINQQIFCNRPSVLDAKKKLLDKGVTVTSGRIIAEQTLSFWTSFFENYLYGRLQANPIKIFKYLPSEVKRKTVATELNSIRLFRNRISHNEPICFVSNNIDFTKALEVHASILKILSWIDPKLIVFVSDLDTVVLTISDTNNLLA